MELVSIGKSIRRSCAAVVMMTVAAAGPLAARAAAGPVEVRMTRVPGRIVLELSDAHVKIRKDIRADESTATLTTATDTLTITVRRGILTVSGPGGTMRMGADTGKAYDGLLAVLQRSEAASRARDLLERVTDGPGTFAGQSLLVTRALLEHGTGTTAALNEHRGWVAERASALARSLAPVSTVTRIAWQKTGPGECWDMYSKEAIRIAMDFEDCTAALKWYEAHKWAGCSLLYVVRAEAAMAWFIACNGGVPFNG